MSTPESRDDEAVIGHEKASASIVKMPVQPWRLLQFAGPEGPPLDEDRPPPDPESVIASTGANDDALREAAGKLSLVTALELIAGHWFGREPELAEPWSVTGALAPETAIAFASELGLDLATRETKLSVLRDSDLPCLVMDKDGQCRVLVRRINYWAFVCRTADADVPIDRKHLESTYSGTVFLVRPIEGFVPRPANGSVDADAAHADDRPVETVIGYMVSTMFTKRAGAVIQLVFAGAVSNLLLILVPVFSMAVYDRVLPHLAYETLWALTIGITIAFFVDLALRHVKVRIIDSIAADISHGVQVRFYRRLVYGQLKTTPRTGGALAQTMRDLESYSQLIPMLMLSLFVDFPFIVITSIILANVAGSVAIVPMAGALIVGLIFAVAHLVSRARLAPFLVLMRLQSNSLIETIEGLETVKTATGESTLLNKWERLADATAYNSHMSRLAHAFSQQWAMSISQAMTVATLVLGVYEISQNAMTVGALSMSTMLVGRLIGPITQFIGQSQRIVQARKTLEPIRAVLNAPIERAGDGGFTLNRSIQGSVSVLNVTYTYPGSHAPSLNDVSLTIKPGERIGIIGRVGSGKSTLLRLMVRLLEPTSGAIRLDGNDIRQFDPRDIRRKFAYMKQDTGLFDDTLKANLFFGLERPDPAQVESAMTLSGVAAFAGKNPEGYGLRVGPRGERLSGGERQAVGLARAMVGNPTMLLLDEPTASMDNTAERQIINGLQQWLTGRTVVVATHRAAMLDLVDRVILMHEGKIIADGPKEEVLKKLQDG
jgi:ATP-binding cassette subfamily C protein LapB